MMTLVPLQRVTNMAARTVFVYLISDHMTSALPESYSLPVTSRIKYKLCLLAHKAVVGHAPRYIADLLMQIAEIPAWSALRVSTHCDFMVWRPRLKTGSRCIFCRCSDSINSTTDRVKTVSINHTVQAQTKNFSVYFIIRSI